jgi:hypothetical protein
MDLRTGKGSNDHAILGAIILAFLILQLSFRLVVESRPNLSKSAEECQ